MKLLNILLQTIKWGFVFILLMLAIATLLARCYGQSITLFFAATALVCWPEYLKSRLGNLVSGISRGLFIVCMIALSFTVFSSGPKTTIYTSEENKQKLYEIYNRKQESWPAYTRDIYLQSKYGAVHVLSCGSPKNPPLAMFHAASMGAHSWAENLKPLLDDYCIYVFDNIGEGNKSELTNALEFPRTGKEIADLYASLFDSLHIQAAPVFGSSNGGYIAQVLTFYHPNKVKALALFGPMGLTQLSNTSIFMMSVGSMYPLGFVRKTVTRWAIGNNEYCSQKYGDWFDCIIKATIPSIAHPLPMTTVQKQKMTVPVILFLGTNDPIVGNAELAKAKALDYPNIEIEILESGHLIAVEQSDFINKRMQIFLK